MKFNHMFLNLAITLLIFIVPSILLAADEAIISDLQTDVSITKNKADQNKADIENLKGGIPTQIEALQQQIDNIELTPGPQGIPGLVGPTGPQGELGPQGPTGPQG